LGEAWRLFPEFADQCVYLDIETTGLSTVFDTVTLVGLYDGRKYRVFIAGQNMDEFAAELSKYSVVVTFNGSGFDLRFLKLAFPGLVLPPVHIDLRWVTRKLGMKGGLKEIEAKFGLSRDYSVADITGFDATVLWSKFLRGDKPALEQLIQYNTEDVVHLLTCSNTPKKAFKSPGFSDTCAYAASRANEKSQTMRVWLSDCARFT
jgi:uncharacterized protein